MNKWWKKDRLANEWRMGERKINKWKVENSIKKWKKMDKRLSGKWTDG